MYPTIITVLSLLFLTFFSGLETAFVSVNKLRIEIDTKQGSIVSGIHKYFAKNASRYISALLLGSSISVIVFVLYFSDLLASYFITTNSEFLKWVLIAGILTFFIILSAVIIPNTLFKINPNRTLSLFTFPSLFFYLLFYPLTSLFSGLSVAILKWGFRVKLKENDALGFCKTDLELLVYESQQNEQENQELNHDVKIFQNALDFSNVKIRECVVPRTEIEAVSIDDSVAFLKQRFIDTGYSKILVYQDTIDNIIGFAHSIDLFGKPDHIKPMVRKLPIIPETMPASKLLALFIQNKKSMALVVDEFGGTSGVVTMEDILEEIVGDIQDEHDKIQLEDEQISETEYHFSGRIEIDDVNEKYHLDLPVSDDYETIAGFILSHHGSIPKVKDVVTVGPFSFKIMKATHTKIELIHLKINK